MNMLDTIKERFEQLQTKNGNGLLLPIEQNAFNAFTTWGIPTVKHEEWKYTRISGAFNKEYAFSPESLSVSLSPAELAAIKLPGYEEANELVFVNGFFTPALST